MQGECLDLCKFKGLATLFVCLERRVEVVVNVDIIYRFRRLSLDWFWARASLVGIVLVAAR